MILPFLIVSVTFDKYFIFVNAYRRKGVLSLIYYLCAIFTTISAAVSFGFSIEAYSAAKRQSSTSLTTAKYAISRSLALLVVAIGLVFFISHPYLIALATAMTLVQLFDGVIGLKISRFKTIGPLLTALINAILLLLLIK